jgi:hypothetical protein
VAALAALAVGCAPSGPSPTGIDEMSGITRSGDRLIAVGDDDAEICLLRPGAVDERGMLAISPERIQRVKLAFPGATDLEAVAVLADGRIVALSEDARAIYDTEGMVARWDASLAEWGGRGLEGLAVRAAPDGGSRIAVTWEGGYPDCRSLPASAPDDACGRARRPRLVVHHLPAGARERELDPADALVDTELQVPLLPGEEPCGQRFRAADVLWIDLPDGSEGFLVLLSSQAGERAAPGSECECPKKEQDGSARRYCHKWLLRFDAAGGPVGEPFDLDEVFPAEIATSNWEGMGWWEEGESLVLCYDEEWTERRIDPQCALRVELPETWRAAAPGPGDGSRRSPGGSSD